MPHPATFSSYLPIETIEYGYATRFVNVFPTIQQQFDGNRNLLFVPCGDDARFAFFQPLPDPVPGIKKVLLINGCLEISEKERLFVIRVFREGEILFFGGLWNAAKVKSELQQHIHFQVSSADESKEDADTTMEYHFMGTELPEQVLLYSFLPAILRGFSETSSKSVNVLELGGNIGRATMVIRRVLQQLFGVLEERPVIRQVVTETFPSIAQELRSTLHRNHMLQDIDVVQACLNDPDRFSLVQTGWKVHAYDNRLPLERVSYRVEQARASDPNNALYKTTEIPSIHYATLCKRYFQEEKPSIWVVDCEGFFLDILNQFPECVRDIDLLFLENDFAKKEDKQKVDDRLREMHLYPLFSLPGGLDRHPCKSNFYEVWIREQSSLSEQLLLNVQSGRLLMTCGFDFFSGLKQTISTEIPTSFVFEKKENVKMERIQEIDFGAESSGGTTRDHEFLVFSIQGCTKCDQFMTLSESLKEDMEEGEERSIRITKLDVTNQVRHLPDGKEKFAVYLEDNYRYKRNPSANAKMYFPIIVYNGRYLGDNIPALTKLESLL